MPYTIGASHGPFTGQGSFVVAKPVGIRTVLSSVPSWTGHDGGDPRRYFKLGRFTMGNVDGFQFSHGIEYGQQLLYPMPPVWELLAYDIKNGASCLFQELVDVPDLSLKQPWDRTMLDLSRAFNTDTVSVVSETTGFTYTVPTARKLLVAQAECWISCATTQTAGARSIIRMFKSGTGILHVIMYSMTANQRQASALGGGPMILAAGETLSVTYQINTAGGLTAFGAQFSGFLFDA